MKGLFIRLTAILPLACLIADVGVAQEIGTRDNVLERLNQKCSLEFVEDTLADVAETLAKEVGVPVYLDKASLGIGPGSASPAYLISFSCADLACHSAMSLFLEEQDLGYSIGPGYLQLTTREVAEKSVFPRVYDVTNLVGGVPSTDRDAIEIVSTKFYGLPDVDHFSLTDLIEDTIAPYSWVSVGGEGSINAYASNGRVSLVVAQSATIHFELEAFLKNLDRQHADRNDEESPDTEVRGDATSFTRIYLLNSDDISASDFAKLVEASFPRAWWNEDEYFAKAIGDLMVVRQSPDRHRDIHKLLTKLGAFPWQGGGL